MSKAVEESIAQKVADSVKNFVARTMAPLSAKVSALARQQESCEQLIADLDLRLSQLEKLK